MRKTIINILKEYIMEIKYICKECGKKFPESEKVEFEVGRHVNKHVEARYCPPSRGKKLLQRYGNNLAGMIVKQ
jgi:DNA-directed RNA polymerase subunit RPC12/RpoP